MRVVSWNVRGANQNSLVWATLLDLKPDVALLQEVGEIPTNVMDEFEVKSERATRKTGGLQRFSTAVLVKGKIIDDLSLSSEYIWVNRELQYFKGNFVSCVAQPFGEKALNIVSVYSPAWPVDEKRLKGMDVSSVKLTFNDLVWPTEIIWSALSKMVTAEESWIVGGDYNASETFDTFWAGGPRGNKEIIDRMYALGFKECLREHNGRLIPTFKNAQNGKILHQIDHLFVTAHIYSRLHKCAVGDQSKVFGRALSDHLPIVADFNVAV